MNSTQKPRNNVLIKILSVVAALFLWMYVMNEQNPTIARTYTIDLDFHNASKNMVFTSAVKGVKVKVSGPMTIISDISAKDISAYVDLQNTEKGSSVKKVMATIPENMQLVEIIPDNITVNADIRSSRTFPVSIKFSNNLPEELAAKTLSLEPSQVVARGGVDALSRVERIEAVFNFEPLMRQKGQYKSLTELIAVDKNDVAIENITLDPVYISATVEVVDRESQSTVEIKPAFVGTVAQGYKIANVEIMPDKAALKGNLANIRNIKELFTAPISLDGKNADFSVDVPLALPDGITAEQTNVTVNIKLEKQGG